MQRWIAGGLVAMMLFLGGSYFAYRTYKQNRPSPIWVPVAINPNLPTMKRDEIISNLKKRLGETSNLERVSRDLKLPGKMGLPTDHDVAVELNKRLFVRAGDMDTPMGKVAAIHIGVSGKVKEVAISGEIAMRLMDDAWSIMGIDPPPKKTGL